MASAIITRGTTPVPISCGDALATMGGTPLQVCQSPTKGDPSFALVSPQRTGSPRAHWISNSQNAACYNRGRSASFQEWEKRTELAPQGRSGSLRLITQNFALSTERVLHQKLTTDGSLNCLNNMQPFWMDQACERSQAPK